jgi:hypothetical protein
LWGLYEKVDEYRQKFQINFFLQAIFFKEGVEAMEAYKRSNIAFQKILGRYIHETERRWVEAISKHDSREFGANEMDQLSKDFVENELRLVL